MMYCAKQRFTKAEYLHLGTGLQSHLTYKRHLPAESIIELWVIYPPTPCRSGVTADGEEEEEDETLIKASTLSTLQCPCAWK